MLNTKYSFLNSDIDRLAAEGKSKSDIARELQTVFSKELKASSFHGVRCYVGDYIKFKEITQQHPALSQECETKGIPIEDVKHYWHKGEHFSIFVKGKEINYDDIRSEIIQDMAAHAPKYPVVKQKKVKDPVLLVVDPADPHFGKYASKEETGDGYDLKTAIQRFEEGIEGIIQKASFANTERIVLIGGNDALHIDNAKRTTTSGTPQDTDGMWFEAFRAAQKAYVGAIERLLSIAPVHYVPALSNHDYVSGLYLADCIGAWFRNCKHFTHDNSPAHRKYFHYGLNLIGVTHGDGAKEADLPDLMKTEAKQAWAQSHFAYWYTHHLHHKRKNARIGNKSITIERDKIGVTVLHTNTGVEQNMNDYTHVEYLRSISGTDSWHHRNGYQHSVKAMEAFIHDPNFGQVSRLTHIF